jgi:hypothetical protein
MTLMQAVFWLTWDGEQKTWESEVDGSSVRGSWSSVAQKLSEGGWEIVTVTPVQWATTYGSKAPGVLDSSGTTVQLLAITAKKQSDERATG